MEVKTSREYRLTAYSHGAGCGCKIAPGVLSEILQSSEPKLQYSNLLVGNENRDDAAVFDLGDGTALISTTDFFMPIVDDAFDFGRIASVNAISDIYAMGGQPLMAIAILGWPIKTLPAALAAKVMEGAKAACKAAGIPLAGGHSIDSPEPIFGLAVSGKVQIEHLKKNAGAKPGDLLYLSKGLGVGILSTAQKKSKIKPDHLHIARDSMIELNDAGLTFGRLSYVHAMTDVTGFGLLGHLREMCEASNCTATIYYDQVPLINREIIDHYLDENCVPGGSRRNWDSYGHLITKISERQQQILCDPQTSGGLLIAVDKAYTADFEKEAQNIGLDLKPIGAMQGSAEQLIEVL